MTRMKNAGKLAKLKDQESSAKLTDERIEALGDWRGEMLAHVRVLIMQSEPDMLEELKWKRPSNPGGVTVWSHNGIVCTGETYRNKVKLTFARGAALGDPSHLFNASMEGKVRRAIDLHEGDSIDEAAFQTLVRAAVALNAS